VRSESLTENEDSGEEEPKYGPVPENIIMYKFNYLIKANKNYVIFSCLLMQIQHITSTYSSSTSSQIVPHLTK
jgi:hypothetical protein